MLRFLSFWNADLRKISHLLSGGAHAYDALAAPGTRAACPVIAWTRLLCAPCRGSLSDSWIDTRAAGQSGWASLNPVYDHVLTTPAARTGGAEYESWTL